MQATGYGTGFAGAGAARVLARIDPLAKLAAMRGMAGCDFPRQWLKAQIQFFTRWNRQEIQEIRHSRRWHACCYSFLKNLGFRALEE
ncbi:MAG: hypothetical protein WBE85_00730 [Methylocella sp.]